MRDDFSQRTKDLLANRVGWKCSNPNCRKATRGAGIGKENIINIGVASHITAASKGGPRYDENITSQERASAENGIWLCQSCSKLIDSDVNRYTIAKLKKWKEISEQMAVLDLEEATAEETVRVVTLALSFFLTVLYLNFNETPQPSLRELEKMIKEIEVSEINEKDNSEEMEREQYINDNSRENWDLSGDILDCFKRYSNELSVEEQEEIIKGIEDGLTDQEIKRYFVVYGAEKMRQYRRVLTVQKNKQ